MLAQTNPWRDWRLAAALAIASTLIVLPMGCGGAGSQTDNGEENGDDNGDDDNGDNGDNGEDDENESLAFDLELISYGAGGDSADGDQLWSVPTDGGTVAFTDDGEELAALAGSSSGSEVNVFARDRDSGDLEMISLNNNGEPLDSSLAFATRHHRPAIDAGERWVAFEHPTGLLESEDAGNFSRQIFLRDRDVNETHLISRVGGDGAPADENSDTVSIDADATGVVFASNANLLSGGGTHGTSIAPEQVYRYDIDQEDIERVSVNDAGAAAEGSGNHAPEPRLAPGGDHVAFVADGDNLDDDITNDEPDIFVRDLIDGTTERVSFSDEGEELDAGSFSPDLSADGQVVVFVSAADVVAAQREDDDTTTTNQVFVLDRETEEIEWVSEEAGPALVPSISADGRFVAFETTDGAVYHYDREEEILSRVYGTAGNPVISPNGQIVGFDTTDRFVVPLSEASLDSSNDTFVGEVRAD